MAVKTDVVQALFFPTKEIIEILARTTKFIAAEKLVVNVSKNAELKISYLGDNFKN